MHIELPILGGHVLMGSDAPESMGHHVIVGNNFHIMLEPDTKAATKKLFDAISEGGKITMELQDMFWGAYYGTITDKFSVQWMFNCSEKG
jgi:PhnB protein